MRQRFETDRNFHDEELVAAAIADGLGLRQAKLADRGNVGYAYVDRVFYHGLGNAVAFFGEIKCRTCPHDRFPTLILSLQKWERLVSLRRASGRGVLLFVHYSDGLRYYAIPPEPPTFAVAFGGRTTQTRDAADVEPVVHIPARYLDAWDYAGGGDGI